MTGITDPTQEYFKDGGWGHDGTQWRKLPLLWGYSDVWRERLWELNPLTIEYRLYMTVVPTGEVWVAKHAITVDINTVCTRHLIQVYDGAKFFDTIAAESPAAGIPQNYHLDIVLKAGDQLAVIFVGSAVGDDLYFFTQGYKMVIA